RMVPHAWPRVAISDLASDSANDVQRERRDRHEQERKGDVTHRPGVVWRRQHAHAHEQITRNRIRTGVVAVAAHAQLGAVLDTRRDAQPQPPLRLDRSGAVAEAALRIGESHGISIHARWAADDRVKADDATSPIFGLEAAQLEIGVDVLAANRLGRPGLRQPLVEALVAAPAEAVAIVEETGLALRQHGVGLGELTESR